VTRPGIPSPAPPRRGYGPRAGHTGAAHVSRVLASLPAGEGITAALARREGAGKAALPRMAPGGLGPPPGMAWPRAASVRRPA